MLVVGSGNSDRFAMYPAVTTNAVISAITDIRNLDLLTIQFMTTDSAGIYGGATAGTGLAGAWKVEVSNSYVGQPDQLMGGNANNGSWIDVTSTFSPAIPSPTGAAPAQSFPITMNDIGFRHLRISFTPTNGNTFVPSDAQHAGAFLVGKNRS